MAETSSSTRITSGRYLHVAESHSSPIYVQLPSSTNANPPSSSFRTAVRFDHSSPDCNRHDYSYTTPVVADNPYTRICSIHIYLLHKWQPRHQLTSSFRAIARLCAISMMVNIGSQWFLQHEYTYAEYPVMMLASLAAFPLTLLESLLLVVPTLIGLVVSNLLDWQSLWLLTILSVVASVASASQLSTIIVLVKQASYDSLTGVLSRRSGEEMLNLLQTNSNHQPLSVVFLTLTTLRKSMTPTDTRWETQCCVRSPGNYRTIFDLVMWWSVGVEMSFWC